MAIVVEVSYWILGISSFWNWRLFPMILCSVRPSNHSCLCFDSQRRQFREFRTIWTYFVNFSLKFASELYNFMNSKRFKIYQKFVEILQEIIRNQQYWIKAKSSEFCSFIEFFKEILFPRNNELVEYFFLEWCFYGFLKLVEGFSSCRSFNEIY